MVRGLGLRERFSHWRSGLSGPVGGPAPGPASPVETGRCVSKFLPSGAPDRRRGGRGPRSPRIPSRFPRLDIARRRRWLVGKKDGLEPSLLIRRPALPPVRRPYEHVFRVVERRLDVEVVARAGCELRSRDLSLFRELGAPSIVDDLSSPLGASPGGVQKQREDDLRYCEGCGQGSAPGGRRPRSPPGVRTAPRRGTLGGSTSRAYSSMTSTQGTEVLHGDLGLQEEAGHPIG